MIKKALAITTLALSLLVPTVVFANNAEHETGIEKQVETCTITGVKGMTSCEYLVTTKEKNGGPSESFSFINLIGDDNVEILMFYSSRQGSVTRIGTRLDDKMKRYFTDKGQCNLKKDSISCTAKVNGKEIKAEATFF